MSAINIYDAKAQLSKLVDQAAAGKDVVIARAGKPVARLTRLDAPAQVEVWYFKRQSQICRRLRRSIAR
jgi:prevent-host-death family protein